MNVTKQQLINGIIKYTKNEVLDKVSDKPLKMIIAAGVNALQINPAIADKILNNDYISGILGKDGGGKYDLDMAFDVIEKTIEEYGEFPVVVPAIRFITSNEKEFTFTSRDVRKLKDYILGDANDD